MTSIDFEQALGGDYKVMLVELIKAGIIELDSEDMGTEEFEALVEAGVKEFYDVCSGMFEKLEDYI